jgi:diacylglycerol kinase (ATP)
MTEKHVPERRTGIARIIKAFGYSFEGMIQTFRTEAAFRQEAGLAAVMIPAALYFGPTGLAKAAMVSSVFAVLAVELLNSAIESVVNRWGPEWNLHAKHAKDAASAAVFIALWNVAAVWVLCLFF